MRQAVAQAVVAVLVLGVSGFFLWIVRSRRAALLAGDAALAALARELQITVRSSDPARAQRLLTPDLRGRLREWFRNGTLDGLWTRDGRLQIDGGFGFREDSEVVRARRLLRTGLEIADALER